MTAQILAFTGLTVLPIEPAAALEKAKGWGLAKVVIVGWDTNGKPVIGGSHSEAGETLLLLEIAKLRVLDEIERQMGSE